MTYLQWLSERFRRGQGFAGENARRRRERLAANGGVERSRMSFPHALLALWNGRGAQPGQTQPVSQASPARSSGQAPVSQSGGLKSYFTEPPLPPAPKPPGLPEGVAAIRYAPDVPRLSKQVENQLRREAGARGILTLDISSTIRTDDPRSNHYRGLAADIERVNNQLVEAYPSDPLVRADVNAVVQHANRAKAHEVFAPGPQTFKDGQKYRAANPAKQKELEDQHKNHIHITVGRNPEGGQKSVRVPADKRKLPKPK